MSPPVRTARAEALPARLFSRLASTRFPVRVVSAFCFVVAAAILTAGLFADRRLWSPFFLLTVLFACLWLTPAIHLLRYSWAIERALSSPDPAAVAGVLRQQLRFWRFAGACIVIQVLLLLGVTIEKCA